MSAPRWGIEPSYRDAFGRHQETSVEVRHEIERAMRIERGEPGAADPVAVVRPGAALPEPGEVVLEDGTSLGRLATLPRDAPHGYHHLHAAAGERLLITGPGRCDLPADERSWGWSLQLYAARSRESWGMGDLADLRRLAAWSGEQGAQMLIVNPLNAPAPVVPIQPSPYFPSTRRFRNPLYLRVEEVPGADRTDGLERLAAAGRALNGGALIDRDAVFTLKMDALAAIWRAGAPRDGLAAYCAEIGTPLRQWATYCAIAERHGASWSRWPEELRRPESAAVARFEREHEDRIAFHEWLQWLLDAQLAGAGNGPRLVHDVPIGVDRDGADAWVWQDVLALDANIGAPPDTFNRAGQDWGLPPLIPHRLRAAGYAPFVDTVRSTLRHAGGLRIDHIMGLFRLWWIPLGNDPRRGAYVRYPTEELLEILALESARAGATIVGEDLGTVEPGVRRELARRRILSYRLIFFEKQPPSRYPPGSLGAVTTHDLPTIAGTWLGSDLEVQRRAGIPPDRAGLGKLRSRLARAAEVEPEASLEDVILGVHRALAASPSLMVSATLEDALRVEERPNLPGTVDQHPNWSIPLPVPLEAVMDDAFVRRLAAALRRTGRADP